MSNGRILYYFWSFLDSHDQQLEGRFPLPGTGVFVVSLCLLGEHCHLTVTPLKLHIYEYTNTLYESMHTCMCICMYACSLKTIKCLLIAPPMHFSTTLSVIYLSFITPPLCYPPFDHPQLSPLTPVFPFPHSQHPCPTILHPHSPRHGPFLLSWLLWLLQVTSQI